ncbi:MAG: hypothetical protein E7606_01965, partial [Ruminococcaceae bacterium]|nr:hypothetical protein [Oscillospiraceae bacterium]
MDTKLLINKHLTDKQLERISSLGSNNDPVLFALVGDINAAGEYSETTVAFTAAELIVFESAKADGEVRLRYADMEDIFTKRMYGNALIRVKMKGEEKPQNIYRYTFGIAALCDAAIRFVKGVIQGSESESLLGSVELAYEKQLSVCPRCGRTLSAPGVKCINCESKRKIISRLAVYMKPDLWNIVLSVALSVATTFLMLVPPYLTKTLVDVVLKDVGGVFPPDSAKQLVTIGILLAVFQIVRHVLGMWRAYVMRKCNSGIVKRIRDDVYEHAQYLPMNFYDKTSTGSVINRISGDCSTLQSFMLHITQDAVVEFFRMIGIVVIMLIMSPRLALYSLIPVPLVVIISRVFSKRIAPFYRRIWRKWAAVSGALTDTIPGIRVIKSFTNEKNAIERFERKNQDWYDTNLAAGKILSVYPSFVLLLMGFGSVIIWLLGGFAVLGGSGEITAGLLVSF